jgi:hypothetical protein
MTRCGSLATVRDSTSVTLDLAGGLRLSPSSGVSYIVGCRAV